MHVEIQESRTHKAHIVHQQRPSITKQNDQWVCQKSYTQSIYTISYPHSTALGERTYLQNDDSTA